MSNRRKTPLSAQQRAKFDELFNNMQDRMDRQREIIGRMIQTYGNSVGSLRIIADMDPGPNARGAHAPALREAAERARKIIADIERLTAESSEKPENPQG